LSTLERQFTRLDDLDQKMAAVQLTAETTTKQMTQSATYQQQLSQELQVMKQDTTKQFSAMDSKVLTTMESQHQMSTTMLNVREQLDQMSQFMLEMTSKLELALNRPPDSAPNVQPSVPSRTAAKRSQSGSSTNSVSSKSQHSQDSSHGSSVYRRSPEKKKQCPRDIDKIRKNLDKQNQPMAVDSHHQDSNDMDQDMTSTQEGGEDPNFIYGRTNLEALFNKSKDEETERVDLQLNASQAVIRHIEDTKNSSPSGSSESPAPSHISPSAPLDLQYNSFATDSDGALTS
jgi:hypothetical protein